MKLKKLTIIFLCFSLLVFSGCTKKLEPKETETFLMGTIVKLKVYGKNADKALEDSVRRISDIEKKMSTNITSSEISTINKNAGKKFTKISKDSFNVIKSSINYSKKTSGAFDITVEPLVKLWGIGTDKAHVPSESEIKNKVSYINYNDVILDSKNSYVKLKNENQAIDLGGIAKGYTADEIKKVLLKNDIESAFINLGGNLYVLGKNPEKHANWNIGIQNPLEPRGDYLGIVSTKDKSIVTSGTYERFFEKNGKRYHHIFNTKTGYPAETGLLSVSIISDKSIDGDALSTSSFALGLDKGIKLIESLDNVEAIFVTKNKKVYLTSGLKDNFKLSNTSFKLN
ncbi:FAD:protein FMN transferase [Clostridium oceanicum]|uniref:FAD:protein FMN transferase n=1 Tax=Clostridium oceanicum TaxID=1543 RepID=A0ABP3UYJ5_9CLOT